MNLNLTDELGKVFLILFTSSKCFVMIFSYSWKDTARPLGKLHSLKLLLQFEQYINQRFRADLKQSL
jgi:hypothetical protein